MMNLTQLTGSVYYNYMICPRKAWLMQYQIDPEHEHDLLDQGRLTQQEHYQRGNQEMELPGIKMDRIRRDGDTFVLGEIKKSSSGLEASKLQLAYYLQRLEEEEVGARGEILIPKERKRIEVLLDAEMRKRLKQATQDITVMLKHPRPPKAQWLKYCSNCAYAEFCWSGGESEEDR